MKNIETLNLNISYEDNEKEGAETLILLHGWGANKETMAPLMRGLGDKYRIISLDLPGFGASSALEEPWDTANYVYFLERFVETVLPDAKDESLNFLGHSNGGRILLKYGAARPKVLKRLILIDSAGVPAKHKLDWYVKTYSFKALKKIGSLAPKGSELEAAIKEKQAKAGSTDYRNASPVMKGTMSKLLKEDCTKYMDRIKVPTLLIWGDQDTATPIEDGKLMEKLIPDAGLVALPGASHFSYLERLPQVLATIDYFLSH